MLEARDARKMQKPNQGSEKKRRPLKQAFDARLRGALPAFAGSFEPKWVGCEWCSYRTNIVRKAEQR
jgi:hypothetical protein